VKFVELNREVSQKIVGEKLWD